MKRAAIFIVLSVIGVFFSAQDTIPRVRALSPAVDGRPAYAPGEILVKYKPHLSPSTIRSMERRLGVETIKKLESIQVHRVKLPPNMSVEAALDLYQRSPNVEYAEPNYYRYMLATIPNDTYFSNLWGLHNTGQTVGETTGTEDADMDLPGAWDLVTDCSSIIVAVIDSGVDLNHPDLAGNLWTNTGETAGNDADDDGNGYVDDVNGWDFVDNDNNPMDVTGHGTHVAGTIAARGNNREGITGLCWRAQIMPVRMLNAFGVGTVDQFVGAIDYAVQKGAKILNTSLGGSTYSQSEYDAIARANAAGVLVIAAAGNQSSNNDTKPLYPANHNLPNIISVAATDQNDALASFSNHGARTVHVAAPGKNIYSLKNPRQTVWSENFDDGDMSNWTTGGTNNTWGLTTSLSSSSSYSLTDSPSGNYANGTASWARGPVLDLSSYSGCKLSFWFRGESYSSTDQLYVQTSTDGSTWTDQTIYLRYFGFGISYIYSSLNDAWYGADVDLGEYDGKSTVYFRFYFVTDSSGVKDGWYIDDISVTAASAAYDETEYQYKSGTSMAAPHVAGLGALVWSHFPSFTMAQVRDTILESVDKKTALSDKTVTGGRVNAHNALQCYGTLIAPTGLAADLDAGGAVRLSWTDNSGYEIGFKIERKAGADGTYSEVGIAYTNSTSYIDTTASPGTTHYYRVRSYNCAGNSLYSNETSVTTDPTSSSSGSSTGGCFIATAAFGSPLESRVVILQEFRDRILLRSRAGQHLVDTYYRYSPSMAHYIEKREFLRAVVRIGLLPAVAFGHAAVHWGLGFTLLALTAVGMWVVYGGYAIHKRRWCLSISKRTVIINDPQDGVDRR